MSRNRRVREAVGSLNALASSDGRVRATLDGQPRSECLSTIQESVMQLMRSRVDAVGADLVYHSDQEALTALLKTMTSMRSTSILASRLILLA